MVQEMVLLSMVPYSMVPHKVAPGRRSGRESRRSGRRLQWGRGRECRCMPKADIRPA
jgi:hypothetical protein